MKEKPTMENLIAHIKEKIRYLRRSDGSKYSYTVEKLIS